MKTSRNQVLLAAVLLVCIAGCGTSHTQSDANKSTAAAEATLRVDPNIEATITGKVTLEGEPPKFAPIDMSSEPGCKNSSPVYPQTVVAGNDGSLANVVVYVKGGLGNYRFDPPASPAVLRQKDCMYEPHIVALMVNQPLEIRNDDPTVHNIHLLPKTSEQWNHSQTPGAAPLTTSFALPEMAIPVECNVHPWMRSYMFVFSNPYYAVTSPTGTFELTNLPPGSYTIEAWQEKYGVLDQTITVGPKESKTLAFVYRSSGTKH